jgi:Hypoxia induced protein conserved region
MHLEIFGIIQNDKRLPMTEFLVYALVPIAIGAVAVVLLLGLPNMARGGSPRRSQKLMRLRVLLPFIAIIVIMLTIWAIGTKSS